MQDTNSRPVTKGVMSISHKRSDYKQDNRIVLTEIDLHAFLRHDI